MKKAIVAALILALGANAVLASGGADEERRLPAEAELKALGCGRVMPLHNDAQGGYWVLYSTPCLGTSAKVTAWDWTSTKATAPNGKKFDGAFYSVFIVDDEKSANKSLSALKNAGFGLVKAANFKEVVAKAKALAGERLEAGQHQVTVKLLRVTDEGALEGIVLKMKEVK